MSTIDHKAEAEKIVNAVDATQGWMVTITREEFISVAQVHATLAMLEQQLIANLIAFTDAVSVEVRAGAKPSELVWERFESAGKQIIDGLGL